MTQAEGHPTTHRAFDARLDEIVADAGLGVSEKLTAILREGNQLFGTAFALVSRVDGDVYKVLHSESEIAPADPGAEFALGDTYCVHTLQAGGPVAYHQAGQSELSGHPCYSVFQLETYIGAPILYAANAAGTVNFTNMDARSPFAEEDLAAVLKIANQVEALLSAA